MQLATNKLSDRPQWLISPEQSTVHSPQSTVHTPQSILHTPYSVPSPHPSLSPTLSPRRLARHYTPSRHATGSRDACWPPPPPTTNLRPHDHRPICLVQQPATSNQHHTPRPAGASTCLPSLSPHRHLQHCNIAIGTQSTPHTEDRRHSCRELQYKPCGRPAGCQLLQIVAELGEGRCAL